MAYDGAFHSAFTLKHGVYGAFNLFEAVTTAMSERQNKINWKNSNHYCKLRTIKSIMTHLMFSSEILFFFF